MARMVKINPIANQDMIEGFMDGYDINAPEPSGNRSYSYKHGFMAGRNDKLLDSDKPFSGLHYETIILMAEEAIRKDCRA